MASNEPSAGSPRQSSTEVLIRKCVQLGQITEVEAATVIQHWASTASNKNVAERSKDLHHFVFATFEARAGAVWQGT